MEKINVSLYGGKGILGGKETPLEADEIFCDMSGKCSFFQMGKCLRCRSFMSPSCKFGKTITTKGYTSRAAKYYSFKEKYKGDANYNKLSYPSELASVMGDYLYIFTQYVNVHERTERDEKWKQDINGYIVDNCGFGSNYVFIPLDKVTNELLLSIFSYRPTALMGGVITDWGKKRVPQILQDMKKCAPTIYENFVSKHPEYKYEPDYIGKRAFIDSLKPGATFKFKNVFWDFDGEYIESAEEIDIGLGSPWWTEGGTKTKVKIKVNPKMTFEVNDNGIIDENVRFV